MVEALALDAPKTKLFAQKIKGMGLDGTVLVVTDKLDENLLSVLAQPARRAGARDARGRSGEPGALQQRAADQGRRGAIRGDAGMTTAQISTTPSA